jgi:hypothetical protein
MLCPYCHIEMLKGRIQTQGGMTLLWLPEEYKFRHPLGSPLAVIMGKCGIWKPPSAESFYCPDCEKVITDVKKE